MTDMEDCSLGHCTSDNWKDSHVSQCRTIHLFIVVGEREGISWHIAQEKFSWHNCFVPFWKVSWSHCIILCLCLLEFWILNSFATISDLCIGVKRFQLKCNYCRWNENRRAGIWVDRIVRYHPDWWVNILEGDPWDDMVLMSFSKCVLAVWVAQIPSVK